MVQFLNLFLTPMVAVLIHRRRGGEIPTLLDLVVCYGAYAALTFCGAKLLGGFVALFDSAFTLSLDRAGYTVFAIACACALPSLIEFLRASLRIEVVPANGGHED